MPAVFKSIGRVLELPFQGSDHIFLSVKSEETTRRCTVSDLLVRMDWFRDEHRCHQNLTMNPELNREQIMSWARQQLSGSFVISPWTTSRIAIVGIIKAKLSSSGCDKTDFSLADFLRCKNWYFLVDINIQDWVIGTFFLKLCPWQLAFVHVGVLTADFSYAFLGGCSAVCECSLCSSLHREDLILWEWVKCWYIKHFIKLLLHLF